MPAKQTTVEQVNIDNCVDAYNGSRFELILGATKRAREIAHSRAIADRDGPKKYENKPVVAALREIGGA